MTFEIKKIDEILLPKYLGSDREIVQCKTTRLTAAGENYGSLMLAIDLTIRNKKNGKEQKLHIVGKAVPPNEYVKKFFKIPVTFKKELDFYRIVVPTLQEFQRENGIEEVMDFFPEFYGGRIALNESVDDFDDDAVILMENLKAKGYFCVDRIKGYDLDGAKSVLKNLATMHGVPLAIKLKNSELFRKKILPHINTVNLFDGVGDDFINFTAEGCLDIAKENEQCVPLLSRLEKKILESGNISKNPPEPTEPFRTIIHLDLWVNNTMIRTEEGKVVGSKLVDFQMPEYGSPARDLLFFIFDSIQNDIVVKYYDHLVEFYHQNLIDTLKQFDVDTEQFSLQAFKAEIDVVMNVSVLFQCFMMLKPIFATKDEAKQVEDMSEDDMLSNDPVSHELKEKLWMLVTEFAKRRWL